MTSLSRVGVVATTAIRVRPDGQTKSTVVAASRRTWLLLCGRLRLTKLVQCDKPDEIDVGRKRWTSTLENDVGCRE